MIGLVLLILAAGGAGSLVMWAAVTPLKDSPETSPEVLDSWDGVAEALGMTTTADTYGVCAEGHKAACHPDLPATMQSPRAIPCPWVARDRDESDACEKSTPGCSVRHAATGAPSECETW